MPQDKKDKNLNVPPLRFPGFTDEWKKTTLGEITTNFNLRNKEQKNYPMFSVTNNRGFIPQSEQFEDREMKGEDIKAYKVIHHNDFAYNPARINVGSIAKYNGDEPCMISSLYVCFRANNGIDEEWLMHLLHTPKIQYYYQLNGEGGVRIYLFYPNFARIKTSVPTIGEQKKIAKALSLIDERIATQNKIIEDLKKLKSAIIDELYSNVKGNSCNYSNLFTVVSERNSKRLYKKVIAASQEYGMVERDSLNLKIQFDEESINTYKIIDSGDYVIHLRSFQGGFAFSRLHGICSPAYIILRPNERVEFSYFENYFTSTKFINSLRLVTYGIRDGRSINVEEWLSMKVVLPSKEEQRRIIQIIKSIQNKLFNENYILSGLESQRKFCLQNMFK